MNANSIQVGLLYSKTASQSPGSYITRRYQATPHAEIYIPARSAALGSSVFAFRGVFWEFQEPKFNVGEFGATVILLPRPLPLPKKFRSPLASTQSKPHPAFAVA